MPKRVSVIIVGGSHAGPAVSHKLLRQTPNATITLINPSDEYYFNIAAPRFLVKPGCLPQCKYIYSILNAFREYPAGAFTFVKGLVTRIDNSVKSVSVITSADSSKSTVGSFCFDYLAIASGSTTPATLGQARVKLPFKATAFEDTMKTIHVARETLKAARMIVIGGTGPLGVEIAGELAEAPELKKITLLSRTNVLLEGATEPVQKTTLSLLRRRNINILTEVTVEGAQYKTNAQSWKFKLSTGETITADAYIATTGTIPNNGFIPNSFLNSEGWVNVDGCLRVVETGVSRSDTYAIGDITCHPYRLLSIVAGQDSGIHCAKDLARYLFSRSTKENDSCSGGTDHRDRTPRGLDAF